MTDVAPPVATPVMMTDAYVEINGANLSCLTLEVSLTAENKPIEVITFCGVQEYPGPTKYHLICKFLQSFDTGATDDTLQAALAQWATAQTPMDFKIRPYKSRATSPTNPEFTGSVVPYPYNEFGGAAGTASEVDIDWILLDAPARTTTFAATGNGGKAASSSASSSPPA